MPSNTRTITTLGIISVSPDGNITGVYCNPGHDIQTFRYGTMAYKPIQVTIAIYCDEYEYSPNRVATFSYNGSTYTVNERDNTLTLVDVH